MSQFNSMDSSVAADIPMLPDHILESAEELNDGKLWAWTVTQVDGVWVLAAAAANLPGLRPVRNVQFPTRQDAEFAATLHNNQKGLGEDEIKRIIASSVRAESEFVGTLSAAAAKERH